MRRSYQIQLVKQVQKYICKKTKGVREMKKQKKSILILAVMVVFVATGLFLPGLISAGDLEPSSPPGSTMHTLDEIYNKLDQLVSGGEFAPVERTGQTSCWDESGTSVTCTGTGQDGELQKGVTWPVPRFTDNADGTVTDNLTELIWLKDASCPNSTINWSDALSFANSLYDGWTGDGSGGDCGLSDGSSAGDWRLPNVRELYSLVHFGFFSPVVPNTAGTGQWTADDPFTNVSSSYWSSTTCASMTNGAWGVSMYNGVLNSFVKPNLYSVWPVRGGY